MTETMLVLVDPGANSNKFYHVVLNDDGSVTTRYGRVGEPGKTNAPLPGGQRKFDSIVNSKKRKGYQPVELAGSAAAESRDRLSQASKKALGAGDPVLEALVAHLVAVNAHEIRTASGGKLNVVDGAVRTPLGLLTQTAIDEARLILPEVVGPSGRDRERLLSRYMTLVPQNVGRGRGWVDTFLSSDRDVQHQSTFLDQLESSVQMARQTADAGDEDVTGLFRYGIKVVSDEKVISEVKKMYSGSANSMHGSIARAKVKRVFELVDSARDEAKFDKVGNVRRMWHGSRAFNVLSIMSKGLLVPSRSASNVTGRMFGDGLYFSNQSTKSANYSAGGVWSSGRDSRWFMFVADVAMGREYWPNKDAGYSRDYNAILDGRRKDQNGIAWNSINVKEGTLVRNHEAIVPGPAQVKLRYLVEFGD